MTQISSEYAGQYVALIDEQVVAAGKTQLEVYKKAKKNYPKKMITLEYIPTKRETVTFL